MNIFIRLTLAVIFLLSINLSGFSQSVQDEEQGIDKSTPTINQSLSQRKANGIPSGGVLLIPESSNDRIMAFSPITGDLIDADFIPSDPTNLSTPIQVILNHDGTGFLVSDQVDDVIQEYDLNGDYVGVFAPSGGANTSIIDNPRGMCLRPNGNLLVSLGGTANAGACVEFDTDGNYVGVFLPATGTSAFDVILLEDESFMTCEINLDELYQYSSAGAYTGTFASIDNFPEQVFQTSSGNILVGNFSGTQTGVVEFNSGGGLIDIYDPASLSGYRGAYELGNGNLLTTTGTGVHEIDRSGNLVETKISGVSARFITLVEEHQETPISPLTIPAIILVIIAVVAFRFRKLVFGKA